VSEQENTGSHVVRHRMSLAARCTAFSKSTGKRCKQAALRGMQVCIVHGGGSPAAKAEAQRRLATLVDPALEVMYEMLCDKKTPPSTRYSIIKDILDRAGYKPADKSEVSIGWDGDISKLDDEALDRLAYYLEQIAFGGDRARMLQEKKKTLIEAGAAPDVIEAEFSEEGEPEGGWA
jgi:hypothetical protein